MRTSTTDRDDQVFQLGMAKYFDMLYVSRYFEDMVRTVIKRALTRQAKILEKCFGSEYAAAEKKAELDASLEGNDPWVVIHVLAELSYASTYFSIAFYPNRAAEFEILINPWSATKRERLISMGFKQLHSNECIKGMLLTATSMEEIEDEIADYIGRELGDLRIGRLLRNK